MLMKVKSVHLYYSVVSLFLIIRLDKFQFFNQQAYFPIYNYYFTVVLRAVKIT